MTKTRWVPGTVNPSIAVMFAERAREGLVAGPPAPICDAPPPKVLRVEYHGGARRTILDLRLPAPIGTKETGAPPPDAGVSAEPARAPWDEDEPLATPPSFAPRPGDE